MAWPYDQYTNFKLGAPRNWAAAQNTANWAAQKRLNDWTGPMNRVPIETPRGVRQARRRYANQMRELMQGGGMGGGMGGGGYGGGGGASPLNMLLASGMQQQAAANAANQQRFEEIMKGYLKRHDQGMGLADVRANQAYRQMAGDAAQSMVNRGMSNSTEAARKMFDSFEASRQIPLDQFNRTSADPLLFAERKNEVGPDFGQLMQLAQMAGQSQSGIAGQSSPMAQGTNVGSYPAALGLMMARGSNPYSSYAQSAGPRPAPRLAIRPQYSFADPYGISNYRGFAVAPPRGGPGLDKPYQSKGRTKPQFPVTNRPPRRGPNAFMAMLPGEGPLSTVGSTAADREAAESGTQFFTDPQKLTGAGHEGSKVVKPIMNQLIKFFNRPLETSRQIPLQLSKLFNRFPGKAQQPQGDDSDFLTGNQDSILHPTVTPEDAQQQLRDYYDSPLLAGHPKSERVQNVTRPGQYRGLGRITRPPGFDRGVDDPNAPTPGPVPRDSDRESLRPSDILFQDPTGRNAPPRGPQLQDIQPGRDPEYQGQDPFEQMMLNSPDMTFDVALNSWRDYVRTLTRDPTGRWDNMVHIPAPPYLKSEAAYNAWRGRPSDTGFVPRRPPRPR